RLLSLSAHLLLVSLPTASLFFSPALSFCLLHSFPTRRSSDLLLGERVQRDRPADGRRSLSDRSADDVVSAAQRPPDPWSIRTDPDRKSTRLNSSHRTISYAVFCLKKKKIIDNDSNENIYSIND